MTVALLSCCYENEAGACVAYEKQTLLSFKKDLIDPSSRLCSWTAPDADCCKWEGIVCDNITDHVTELHLRHPNGSNLWNQYGPSYFDMFAFRGKLNPSLLNLKQLRSLDLSLNDFGGVPIPSFIGSLKSIEYLNLSYGGFGGIVPPQLGNLSNLHTLSMGGLYVLQDDNLQWLAGLFNLEHLDMTSVNLRGASNWAQVINTIPSLVEEHLSYCQLDRISPLMETNLSSLTVLDLSHNGISFLPRWIFSLGALVSLDLGYNQFQAPWPEGPWNLTSLQFSHLPQNILNGSLPLEILDLSTLVLLDLSKNEIVVAT